MGEKVWEIKKENNFETGFVSANHSIRIYQQELFANFKMEFFEIDHFVYILSFDSTIHFTKDIVWCRDSSSQPHT